MKLCLKKFQLKFIIVLVIYLSLFAFVTACDPFAPDETDSDSYQNSNLSSSTPSQDDNEPIDELETPEPPQDEETPPPTPEPPPPEPVNLVAHTGTVEHIFFHELIAFPEMAFTGDSMERGFDDYMVTVLEYERILESLYRNNFILVDMNDVWSEYTNAQGQLRMQRNTLMLPEGKNPIVISFDDLNFYAYMQGYGFMDRYIIGEDGEIWAEGYDPNGNRIVSQDYTAVTILDRFVRENPGFSHNGAKGAIALTGYEGILGYRTQGSLTDDSEEFQLNRREEIARVRPVVQRLLDTGWYFTSHSFGHIRLDSASLERAQNDGRRWRDEVGSLVGDTVIFIYPFGSRLDGGDVWVANAGPALRYYIEELGFRMFASVGSEPFVHIRDDVPAVMMDRMASDGITLRNRRERFLRLYDAREVFDDRRPNFGNTWGD